METTAPAAAEPEQKVGAMKSTTTPEEKSDEELQSKGGEAAVDEIKSQPVTETSPIIAQTEPPQPVVAKAAQAPSLAQEETGTTSSDGEKRDRSIRVTAQSDVIDKFQSAMPTPAPPSAQALEVLFDTSASPDMNELSKELAASLSANDEIGPNEYDLRSDSLRFWRERRDTYTEAIQYANSLEPKKTFVADAPVGDHSEDASERGSSDSLTWDERVLRARLRLLEAWYRIALLTPDKSEFNEAVEYLRQALQNKDETVREAAERYLKELPDEPRK